MSNSIYSAFSLPQRAGFCVWHGLGALWCGGGDCPGHASGDLCEFESLAASGQGTRYSRASATPSCLCRFNFFSGNAAPADEALDEEQQALLAVPSTP